ncbi:MAG: 2,3,4,5-tetrahydropyridine-2,6-dicarboxylate N-succinyltransferase [Deltaproteobacteria bacterium]|nr:2,3,4,5-tetrahydropyridine-2,6-dicarboxylate N-succinyltransferase [Deltaproteobacteria bacterium]|tara:strand:- start:31894 stop:33060 length:1167 start_codon:yes stop_codon:yes gene_type:complete
MQVKTLEDFKAHVKSLQEAEGYARPLAFGVGVRRSKGGKTLDVTFPHLNKESNYGSAAILASISGFTGGSNGFATLDRAQLAQAYETFAPYHHETEGHFNMKVLKTLSEVARDGEGYADVDVIVYFLFDGSQPVQDPEEAYFKLQSLSQRLVKPHEWNVNGAFGALNNVAWTNYGPIFPEDINDIRLKYLFSERPLQVSHVDKFPYLVDYHLPSGCRITSNSQVRLGAHLGEGTTVMPAGYINFNAGTLGHAMVEGRISGGVVVGNDSDLGGGASVMGTLSGGNKNVISIGEKCLLGANAGTGISLGFGCTIEAGLYITGGMKVYLYNTEKQPVDIDGNVVEAGKNTVKAIELNGRDRMLFIRDSRTGHVICKPNPKTIELNAELHKN